MTQYCPNCDHVLDITRNLRTPHTEKEISAENYEHILKKIENDEQLTRSEILSVNVKDLLKSEQYKQSQKKGKIKKQLIDVIDELQSSDENIGAYLVCSNCLYNEPIKQGLLIYTKNPEKEAAYHENENINVYRNFVFQKTIPRTRNFICPNKDCASHTTEPTEACFFRKPNSYEIIMVCTICYTVK